MYLPSYCLDRCSCFFTETLQGTYPFQWKTCAATVLYTGFGSFTAQASRGGCCGHFSCSCRCCPAVLSIRACTPFYLLLSLLHLIEMYVSVCLHLRNIGQLPQFPF
ncbi:hypothetical protein PVAP13_9KG380851 [Panicum virgatum]|uniref:Uncharacterized protein n=1 Tax=Panicum virgatum TaxID=38727 RepID=A0A8T0NMK9_PANVG|nr:hypothetical protein PVAP13_9KG380851 [Panicum virgatum]